MSQHSQDPARPVDPAAEDTAVAIPVSKGPPKAAAKSVKPVPDVATVPAGVVLRAVPASPERAARPVVQAAEAGSGGGPAVVAQVAPPPGPGPAVDRVPEASAAPRAPSTGPRPGSPATIKPDAAVPVPSPSAPSLPATVAPVAMPAPKTAPMPAVVPTPAPAPAPSPAPAAPRVLAPATSAQLQGRHWLMGLSFVVMVVLPVLVGAWYLWTRAADQYASTVGFSVQREEMGSALDLLGGLGALSGSSTLDTDILYEFLQSQKLVADLDAVLDLETIWSRPDGDPFYAYDASGTIEDLVAYWNRMVRINYDSASGLIELRVLAFDPNDAQRIAQAVFEESSEMINGISAIAREDTVRFARAELDLAVERLKGAREAVTEFRNVNQLVDPAMDLTAQAGVLGSLQSQLAAALVEVDMLGGDASTGPDPRLTQARQRVSVIEARISAERDKLGMGTEGEPGAALASVVGDYERLAVDREFAERSYVAAMAGYDVAFAEARRKSRYLAAHILPTTAESSRFPQRGTTLMLGALFAFLAWTIAVLIAYSVKDRR